jgi:hypothetical protein
MPTQTTLMWTNRPTVLARPCAIRGMSARFRSGPRCKNMQTDQLLAGESGSAQPLPTRRRPPPQMLASFQLASQLTMLGAGQPQTTVPCLHGKVLPWMTQLPRPGKKPRLIATLARGHDGGGGTAPICRSRPRVSQWTHSSTNLPSTIWLSSCPST